MICPVCKSDMIVVEYKNIELDHSLNCGGVWFDVGELPLRTLPEAASSEKRHHCPICGHRMKKTIICKEPEIIIDVCDRGDGLWFDGGELAQLLKQVVKSSGEAYGEWQEVFSFLGEVFHAQE